MRKQITIVLLFSLMISSLFFINVTQTGKAQAGTQVGGIITTNTTWTKDNSPYSLTGALAVNNGVTLTIQSGVVVNINNYYIQVNGTLTAIGMSTDRIQFNDGTITFTAISNGWNESTNLGSIIQYATISTSKFTKYASNVIELKSSVKFDHNILYGNDNYNIDSLIYARNGTISNNYLQADNCMQGITCYGNVVVSDNKITDAYRGIEIISGTPTIMKNLISNTSTCGISITNLGGASNPLVQNNTIVNNQDGLQIFMFYPIPDYSVNASIYYNSFINNLYNVRLQSSLYEEPFPNNINATNNWWGTNDSLAIGQRMYDYNKDFNMGNVTFVPFLMEASTSVPSIDYNPNPTPTPTPTIAPTQSPTNNPTSNPTTNPTSNPTTNPTTNPTPPLIQDPSPSPTPTPTVPEFSILLLLPLLMAVFTIALVARKSTTKKT